MSVTLRSSTTLFALVCATAIVCLINYHQVSSDPLPPASDKPAQGAGDELVFFPDPKECGPDEKPMPGYLEQCEPTCDNPRPICHKMYIFDHVPCFCKSPLVRDTRTKSCVRLQDCKSN